MLNTSFEEEDEPSALVPVLMEYSLLPGGAGGACHLPPPTLEDRVTELEREVCSVRM
jgi:hypothetical protein